MIKAVSALRLAVADVERSLAFYKMLGFQEVPTEGDAREVRSNWFRIRLESRQSKSGSVGLRVCISVDDVETFAAHLATTSKPIAKPRERAPNWSLPTPTGTPCCFSRPKARPRKARSPTKRQPRRHYHIPRFAGELRLS